MNAKSRIMMIKRCFAPSPHKDLTFLAMITVSSYLLTLTKRLLMYVRASVTTKMTKPIAQP